MKKAIIGILLIALVAVNGYHLWYVKNAPAGQIAEEDLVIVKAPEQTQAMQHEYFYVEEYVSVLPDGTNIAPEGKISSNGYTDVYLERKAIDGKTEGPSYWEGKPDNYPNELTVTFAETRTIHAIRLALNPKSIWGKRIQTFAVNYTDAAGEQKQLLASADYEFDPNRGNEVILEFADTEVTSVTLVITNNTGATGGQVAEFEIYE